MIPRGFKHVGILNVILYDECLRKNSVLFFLIRCTANVLPDIRDTLPSTYNKPFPTNVTKITIGLKSDCESGYIL